MYRGRNAAKELSGKKYYSDHLMASNQNFSTGTVLPIYQGTETLTFQIGQSTGLSILNFKKLSPSKTISSSKKIRFIFLFKNIEENIPRLVDFSVSSRKFLAIKLNKISRKNFIFDLEVSE